MKEVMVVTPTNFRRPELHFHVVNMREDLPLESRIDNGLVDGVLKETVISYEEQFEYSA